MIPKVLVRCPIKEDATSFYRGMGPMRHLERKGLIQIIDLNLPNLAVSWDYMMQGDVLFCQRPSTPIDIHLMEIAKGVGVPIWIDYDDDYLNIPESNPRHELYADPYRVQLIKRAIRYADVISASTVSIRDTIIKECGVHATNFILLPNGVDEMLFEVDDTHKDSDINTRNVIMWRGGDTHNSDVKPYLKEMIDLYNNYPQYTWAFVGHASPDFLKAVDTSRVILYPWEEVMTYFDRLFEIRPKLTLVPWEDNVFNAGKSNCSWMEATLAGSVTVFPRWHSQANHGMITYDGPQSFYDVTSNALETDNLVPMLQQAREVLQFYTLENIATIRIRTITNLMLGRKKLGFQPRHYTPATRLSDKEFFDYTVEHQFNQDGEQYRKGHFDIAQKLLDLTKAENIVEFGCGPGPMIEYFCDQKVPQVVGFDINPHFKDYFMKRNPHYKDVYHVQSFLDVDLNGVFDLGIAIEVFEHIEMDKLLPFIQKLASHFRFFYFSSTPYRSSKEFDTQWGHCNINTWEKWVEIFEANGFKRMKNANPHWISLWDLCLESTRITVEEVTSSQPDAWQQPSDSPPQSVVESPLGVQQSVPETASLETFPVASRLLAVPQPTVDPESSYAPVRPVR